MSSDDYAFEGAAPVEQPVARDNNPPLSISELSFALKRTLEDRFGHVRIRGEISKVTRHSSGHVYLTLKDDKAAIDGVIWKGVVRTLSAQPETGLEVIVTGKITSYPARSSYQIVIESMEPAGAGALLAQLERIKARLREEGLFEPSRKKALPAFPATIGVITSPTGAVIRDILHRISDRWPCRVIVWPVIVQGEAAAKQVSNAIRGFDAMTADGAIPRPDLLIVARGGGSVEDLWGFNDEQLARTVAEARIPIISAVGHETDTTLIDFVSDRRAPTPTGAAEMATPVLAELQWGLSDLETRLRRSGARLLDDRRTRLLSVARGLPSRPEDLLALPQQRLDLASSRLGSALHRNASVHEKRLTRVSARLSPALLHRPIERRDDRLQAVAQRLGAALQRNATHHEHALSRVAGKLSRASLDRKMEYVGERLGAIDLRLRPAVERRLSRDQDRLNALSRALAANDPARPKPGFARVEDSDGQWITSAAKLAEGQQVSLIFGDGQRPAVIGTGGTDTAPPAPQTTPKPTPKPAKPKPIPPTEQGTLF
ncbi:MULTISPECIES: exodeoxyribonuclease VII large subunit [unclassified Brevundimonas]|uniref:exodeoxyribonuclease VII large subunit n=1 Tax=unclassified Brevundimonas TaxID=2622653 RepID=UPI0025BD03C5|nr:MULTISPECIES: exodeoxyribonuclease VII large subunit [unclassified Brevundimonas]